MSDVAHPPGQPIQEVAARLAAEFPSVAMPEIANLLVEVHRATDLFGLPASERVAATEKVARLRLRQRTADPDTIHEPRLDPERRRTRHADDLPQL